MLSKPQLGLFWRAFQKACVEQKLKTTTEREAYRKAVMLEECSCAHMADLNKTDDFERIMLRLNLDAGDFIAAAEFEGGNERRKAHLVEVCAAQLMQLQGTAEDEALGYVIGVIQQAQFSCRTDGVMWWLDLIEDQLDSLFAMLDTHRRRLLKADGWKKGLKFNPKHQYLRRSDGRYEIILRPLDGTELLIRVA